MTASALWMAAAALVAASQPYVRSRGGDAASSPFLYWPEGNLTFQQHSGGQPSLGGSEFTAIRTAWKSWQKITDDCSSLKLREGPETASFAVGYDRANLASNANIIVFRLNSCDDSDVVPPSDECWDTEGCANKYNCWSSDGNHTASVIALTTSTFDTRSGRLYDADVEFNAADFHFTAVDPSSGRPKCSVVDGGDCIGYDVQNTMTHEAGHFLGLDHNPDPTSTMSATAPEGEVSKRAIDSQSEKFVCDVYPGGCSAAGTALMPALALLSLWSLPLWGKRRWRRRED